MFISFYRTKHHQQQGTQITGRLFRKVTGDLQDWQNLLSNSVRHNSQTRMRIKYTMPVVLIVALVIIEKENKIISR